MGAREHYIEGYLARQCELHGFLCYKFTSPSNNGVPDRIIIGHGVTAFVEAKAPGEKARKLQKAVHNKMRKFGALVYVVDSRNAVDQLLDMLIKMDTQHNKAEKSRHKKKKSR